MLYLVSHTVIIHCLSEKVGHFYVYDNFGKSGPIFKFFSLLNWKKDLQKKLELKLPFSINSIAQSKCSFKAQLIQFEVMKRC